MPNGSEIRTSVADGAKPFGLAQPRRSLSGGSPHGATSLALNNSSQIGTNSQNGKIASADTFELHPSATARGGER